MKCRQIIKKFGHLKREDLPPEIRAQVDADPEARTWFSQTESQCNLLQLKSYERPPGEVHGRVLYKVTTRIEAGERLPTPELSTPRSALILQMTTVVILLAAGTIVYINNRVTTAPGEGGSQFAVEETPAPALDTGNPPIDELFKPIATAATNRSFLADSNTNSFPTLAPSRPGQSDTQRVLGPPSTP